MIGIMANAFMTATRHEKSAPKFEITHGRRSREEIAESVAIWKQTPKTPAPHSTAA